MQHSQPGNVRMGYTTADSQHGNRHWTEITRPSTPMLSKGWRRSTQTSSTTSITKQSGSLANTLSRGRKTSSNNATSHGKTHFIDGHPKGVVLLAKLVEHGCTRGLTAQILEDRLAETCTQLQADRACPSPGPEAPQPDKKLTRLQTIRNILQAQAGQDQATDQHCFEETKGYLKCTKCGTSVHKRINEKAFNDYLHSPCLDCPFEGQHKGHPSHQLWQKGNKISCTLCGLQLHLDSQQRVISTSNFLKQCKGAGTKGSPPIHSFFKTTPPTQHGGTSGKEPQTNTATPGSSTRFQPRRLHFSTPLTEREEEHEPAQAMIPSQAAGPHTKSTEHAQPSEDHQMQESPETSLALVAALRPKRPSFT